MTKPVTGSALLLLLAMASAAPAAAAQTAQDPPTGTRLQPAEEPADTEEPAPEREEPAADPVPAERPARTAPPPVDIPAAAPPPPAIVVEQVPVPVPVPSGPLIGNGVEILPEAEPFNEAYNEVEVYPEVATSTTDGGGWGWPLIVAAILLLLGAVAFLIARGGRRRPETVVHRETREEAAIPIVPVPAPPVGRPRIDLRLRPLRAGVEGEGARIEFELTVLNEGPVDAQEVRVYTWMTANPGPDATRALLPPPGHVGTPPVSLAAGEARTLQASVALPRAELPGTSLLPAVVADIRYRLPGGGEGRTAAAFSVGLPAGDELGAFPLDGTAGLHQGVIALPLGRAVKT
ncbi:MAG TPA: hypothetical protein VGB70_14365 [Allosphingosinicella sp.]|jgi:hypothetical protein